MRRSDVSAAVLIALLTLFGAAATRAEAQATHPEEDSIFAPYVGVTFGGDTTKKGATFGFSTAYIYGNGVGGEFDVAYDTDFNDVAFESTSLTTVMLNLIAAPRVTFANHRYQPYVVAGLGLIRARGCAGPQCVTTLSRTSLGIDVGGGMMVPLNDVFGVRGDVRYFRYAMNHADLPRTSNGQFDFWRISGGGTITW